MPEKMLERNWKSRRSKRVDKAGHQFTAFHLSPCDREMSSAEYCRDGETLQVAETGGCGSPAPVRKSSFVLQENGELWRAAPFSAVPTAFPVKVGDRSYYGNCIWDALGIATKTPRSMPPAAAAIWKCC